MSQAQTILDAASKAIEHRTPVLPSHELTAFVRSFIDRGDRFLDARRQSGSPLYVVDEDVLLNRARYFAAAFKAEIPDLAVYYAVKSNNCPAIVHALAAAGLGLDVSSGRELGLAMGTDAASIVFSGPGKTDEELRLAVTYRERVTVLMDSFGELHRLERVASNAGISVRAGVRLTTDERGLWRKFGIPLAELPRFITEADECSHVLFQGLQFHTSWNLDPTNHVAFIRRLGDALATLEADSRRRIEFIDIGGGFWPPQGEWLQPAGTREGKLRAAALESSEPERGHYRLETAAIEEFSREIGDALRTNIFPHVSCRICLEPGRWVCNDAMHILLTVVDKKADDLVITDAGTNAIGWERFETDYFPVINLSRPAVAEHRCYVLGSLCTPHDVWGYDYFGEDIQEGDALLVPTQGAYTYSLRQEFIKPLPKVVVLSRDP